MRGAIDGLTPGVDVYAFGILCVEILNRGALPWPIADDEAVRRFVIGSSRLRAHAHALKLTTLYRGEYATQLTGDAHDTAPSVEPHNGTTLAICSLYFTIINRCPVCLEP